MTDKELLELAAKAAGIEVAAHPNNKISKDLVFIHNRQNWNPLTDDGDALRLAVKLDMSVEISAYEESTYAYAGDVPRVHAMEIWRGDKDAATRRAIVRAAAEIGKAMP